MTSDELINIKDYFNIMYDDYGRLYCIQSIGDDKELIKAIRKQNEKIEKYHNTIEKIKEITETALKAYYCNNCDGVGLPECGDHECHTYALDKIMSTIEGAEE